MKTRLYNSRTPIHEIADIHGDPVFTFAQADALKRAGFYVLQDLYVTGLSDSGYDLRIDAEARRACAILEKLDPDLNSIPYTLESLYDNWRAEMLQGDTACVKEDAKFTVPLVVTAPTSRASRHTRIFKQVAASEILDVVSPNGQRYDTDLGAIGLRTSEDDFGYNG